MLESFPSLGENNSLIAEDFSRFSMSYAEILRKHLPTARNVVFVFSIEQAEVYLKENAYAAFEDLLILFKQLKNGGSSCGILGDYLMLCFETKGGVRSIAIVSGADPLFLQRVSEDWLLEIRTTVGNEFLLLKQARIDNLTGLLNVSNLYYLLDTYGSAEGFHLILLELPPKRNSFQYYLRNAQRCATLLLNFVQTDSALHFLGQSTFALVLQHKHEGGRLEIESALVNYLKKEGCHRVHIGSSFLNPDLVEISNKYKQQCRGRQLLDEAWTALRHAARRGPFSFCDFSLLAHPEKHPLTPPARNLVRKLLKLSSHSDTFSLVQFSSDSKDCPASHMISQYIDRGVMISGEEDMFVYLNGAEPEEALEWSKSIINLVEKSEHSCRISAGVSNYPYYDFKKSETILNCRKALLHAEFFGKSSAVVFDAVSLNISGDIYFSEGDLAKAVREYKKGLKCDNLDINLHNSLGVALAMMNKLSPALQSFKNGLAVDTENFMALYNLGLGEQARSRKPEALQYLEKALQHYNHEEAGTEIVNDLRLQLGILSCELGKHEAALAYLVPWQLENNTAQNAGRVHYYLGKAYYGLRNNRKAIMALQRALRFNELDDRAMNLLGRVYFEEGEGNEIALSLCRKSVELEPTNTGYVLHLGEILLQCGLYQEARKNLYRCLKNRDCKMEAQQLLGESYAREGQQRRARSWFEKVIEHEKN